jgi:hypothetical protein
MSERDSSSEHCKSSMLVVLHTRRSCATNRVASHKNASIWVEWMASTQFYKTIELPEDVKIKL